MSFPVNAPKGSAPVFSDIDLGPAGNSVQLMFAALQLSQSRLCKDEAVKHMKEIQTTQQLQKDLSAKIAEARRLQDAAKEKGTAEATQEFVDFCKANGITLPNDGKPVTSFKLNEWGKALIAEFEWQLRDVLKGKDINNLNESDIKAIVDKLKECGHGGRPINATIESISTKETAIRFTAKEWDTIVKDLTSKQELLGSSTQTTMVYLQDFIGQYNSFLQGANSAIATANQVLAGIAKGQ